MPSLRDEITKTLRRLGRRDRTLEASRAETVLATDFRQGKEYGSYRILRRLGFGGMGQVYLALDTRLGRHAALKFLDERLTADPAMLTRLYQEARTASSLNHPNILTIYDIAQAGDEHFIASEYVDGITLRTALNRKLITPKVAVDIATQVASALVPAHAAGIVHRDLKASNIMIRPDGLVKVIDFGLAKLSEDIAEARAATSQLAGPVSSPGSVTGTVEYMSPEQARGDFVDQRSDLWSLGVVLYEMLAGRFPFDGATESHVIVGILDRPVPPIENASSLPRGVTEILNRALAKDLNRRYQSAGELLIALQNLGVTKQRISAIKQFVARADSKRPKMPALLLAAALTLASAFAIWWFGFHGRELVFGPDWFEPGPAEQVTFNGKLRLATISPDGNYVAYTTREAGEDTLHIRDLSAKTEWHLPPYAENTPGLVFSPDSQSVFYVLKDQREWGRLFSVDVHGKVPKILLDDIDGPVTFSPDGKQFAFMRRSEDKRSSVEKIILADANDTGSQREIVKKINTHIGRKLAWSNQGAQIAAFIFGTSLHSTQRGNLSLFSTDGSPIRAPLSDPEIRSMGSPAWISDTGIIAFAGVTSWRTNQQAGLYEVATGSGQFRSLPSPTLAIDSISATAKGDAIAAVQRTRKASFWVADRAAPNSPHQIVPSGETDTGSFDLFSWDGQSNLIFPSAQARSINLLRLSQSGKIEKLTDTQGCVEQAPVFAAAQSTLIYSSNCATLGSDYNLWQLNLKTRQVSQLTSGSSQDEEPDVTPAGDQIIYTAWTSYIPSLWKLPLSGGTPQQLSNVQARHPAISPDGASVLCEIRESYDGRWRYAILSLANGSIEKEFLDLPVSDVRARWEHDGNAIDFVDAEGTQIWRKPLNGGSASPLSLKYSDLISDFSWNFDGSKLAFATVHSSNDIILFHRKATRH
jgi:serine/threonine protein kinase/dipeptidyl aminopeptidase/acylaminoacyl peptidase